MSIADTLKDQFLQGANVIHRTLLQVSGGRIGAKVGDMPVAMQPKLLRVLESGEVIRLGTNDAIESRSAIHSARASACAVLPALRWSSTHAFIASISWSASARS